MLLTMNADINDRTKVGGATPLHRAAYNGHNKLVELLLAKGANVNVKGEEGITPLYLAVFEGHGSTAELLISAGADVNAKNDDGYNSLDIAIERGYEDIVHLLRENRAI